jgi:hypothetical protein
MTWQEDLPLELKGTKEDDQSRGRYLRELRSRLGRFSRDFAERKVSDLSAGELDTWLRSLGQSPLSRNTYHLRLHTLFEYCRTRGWLVLNPLKMFPEPESLRRERSASFPLTRWRGS